MAERWPPAPDLELEQLLRRLGEQIAFPPTPPLAAAVRRSILVHGRPRPARWRRFGVVLAAATLIAVLLLALSPTIRTAVAGRLGLRGISIHQAPSVPTAPTTLPLPTAAPTAPTALPLPAAAPTSTAAGRTGA